MQALFTWLISLQFAVIATHDLVDIPGWVRASQVQSVVGRRKLWLATVINSVFPGLAVAFAFLFWNRSRPTYVYAYWVLYCGVTVVSAIIMWWVPYFLGASQKWTQMYSTMYANTRHILPRRGDNPRPNSAHVCFHVLFVINLVLAVLLIANGR